MKTRQYGASSSLIAAYKQEKSGKIQKVFTRLAVLMQPIPNKSHHL